MAIGDRLPGKGPAIQYSNQRPDPAAFGAGVERAVKGLAGEFDDAAETALQISGRLKQRNEKEEDFKTEQSYIRFIGEQNRLQAERIRGASEAATGVTNKTEEEIGAAREQWLSTVPERLREEYRTKIVAYEEKTITSAFNYEYQAGTNKFVKDVNETLNEEASSVLLGDKSADEARGNIFNLIDRSDLDEPTKRDLKDKAEAFLLKAEFQKETEYAVEFKGTVKPKSEGDVVAAGLLPHERGILNAIARPESNDQYDRIYSGDGVERFTDFSDHPRKYNTITSGPNKGKKSSAAGKYQFLASTWDATVRKYNAAHPNNPITDFSPESQDRIALFYAREIYNRQVGPGEMTFDQVLTSGNRELIKSMKNALTDDKGGWEGFRNMSADAFANIILGSRGIAGGGTGASTGPDVWTDPRYAALSFAEKNTLANAAATAVHNRDVAAAKAAKDQQEAVTEQTMMDTIAGKYTLADKLDLIESGRLKDSAAVAKWEGIVNKRDKDSSQIARVTEKLNSGGPLLASDANGLDLYFGQEGSDRLQALDTDFAQNTLLPIAATAGYFPATVSRDLNGMILGSNKQARDYAMGILGAAYSADPSILERSSGLSPRAKDQVALMDAFRGLYTPGQIAERFDDIHDPAKAGVLREARKEARTIVQKNYTEADALSLYDSYVPNDAPSSSLDRGQRAAFKRDFETAFVEGYVLFGDESGAEKYATKLLQKHWRPTAIGGTIRLSKFPPEVFYETINGSHDWIDAQARRDLGFTSDQQFELVADAQTELEGKRFAQAEDKEGLVNASYGVVYIGENGLPTALTYEDGSPRRWAAEITPEMEASIGAASHYAGLKAQADAIIDLAATGTALPEGTSARLEQLRAEMQEVRAQNPAAVENKIMSDVNKADLEQDIADWQEMIEKKKALGQSTAVLENQLAEMQDELKGLD